MTDQYGTEPETVPDLLPTQKEVWQSMTHFDEIAVRKAFGVDSGKLGTDQPVTFTRCLVFTLLRRRGIDDFKARKTVFEHTNGELQAYFRPASKDGDVDQEDDTATV